ncbi:MAG: FecR domain-containing protein [Candidatus Altimarinota bacterium]
MDQKNLTEQLQKLFSTHQAPRMTSRRMKNVKGDLFLRIEEIERNAAEKMMISQLKKRYKGTNELQQARTKAAVMEQIRQEPMLTHADELLSAFFLFSRKAVAMGFAFLLVLTTFLGPFQTLTPLRMVSVTQAAYLECRGTVYVNGEVCSTEGLREVQVGDAISTDSGSLATLFYADYTVVRLNDQTKATLDPTDRSRIHLSEGNVWLHSTAEGVKGSFKVDTDVIRAKVPQGSAGVSARGALTQLYSSTAAVEVQIENTPGTTELMTLAPEKQLLVRKTRAKPRVQELPLAVKTPEWVTDNRLMDQEYLEMVRKKTFESTVAGAGLLPGSFPDFLQKITQSARTVLTWDQQARLNRQLTELDELFSESLVLLEKGDITTAEETLKAYQQKFVSLLASPSDTIRLEISAAETDSFGELLRYHARLVSPYSPEDDEYLLKQEVERIAVNTVVLQRNPYAKAVATEAITNKLLLAHQALAFQNEALAEEILLEVSEFVPQVLPSAPMAIDTSDLTLLNSLLVKSDLIAPLARDIKRMKIDQLRSLTPQNQTPLVVAGNVTGTAYRPSEAQVGTPAGETVKIVGQAVRDDESL